MHNDEVMEQEIVDKGLNAPRISLGHVIRMMDRVSYTIDQPKGTTSTFAHAFLDGRFYLALGHTACVEPSNFDAELGKKYAIQSAQANAQSKLYELEGYRLYQELNHE